VLLSEVDVVIIVAVVMVVVEVVVVIVVVVVRTGILNTSPGGPSPRISGSSRRRLFELLSAPFCPDVTLSDWSQGFGDVTG
jgi:hypothetical protein